MAILPIRDLGSVGVVTDQNAYNLPMNGFSTAINCRFDENQVSRSPVFRRVKDTLGFSPRLVYGIVPAAGFDTAIIASDAWGIYEYNSGTVSNVSGSITGSSDPRPYTATSLAGVAYINRPDRVPVYRGPSGSTFADLPNWDAGWRANSLRSFGDFMLAIGMEEGGVNYPSRVRWSDITQANQVPGTWSEFDLTASSGFNDLVQVTTELKDGAPLGSNFILYSSNQVWLMEQTGSQLVFNFRQLFTDAGVINQNCIAQVNGQHYVFSDDDIFTHDGTTKRSICDQRVKDFIFSSLNNQAADVCFVQYNPTLNEIMFCYQSGDQYVAYPNADRCNRAAVYNVTNGTWSFMDLPNVSAGTIANVNSVATFATVTGSYNLIGGSYYSQTNSFDRHTLMVGEQLTVDGITSDKLYGLDLADAGQISFLLDTEATKPIFLERVGLDLDEAGLNANQYVVVTRMYPQIDTDNTSSYLMTFETGASDIPRDAPTYTSTASFNISTDYKIDTRSAGRYLSYKVTMPTLTDFQFSGFDLEVTTTGRR